MGDHTKMRRQNFVNIVTNSHLEDHEAFVFSAHRSSISDTETLDTEALGALKVNSAARRCASFFEVWLRRVERRR
jgi:hypothetical protein